MYCKIVNEIQNIKEYKNTPFYVYISLNNRCNSNCIFCNVHDEKYKDNIIDVKKLICQLNDMGTRYIHFIGGGEPLIDLNILEYVELISELGMKVAITTNGYALNKEIIIRLNKCNVSHMILSIDGHCADIHDGLRKINGMWNRVTENLQYIKKFMPNTKIVVNHLLNNRNIEHLQKMIEAKSKLGYDFLNILLIKDCKELYFTDEQIKSYSCNIDNLYKTAKKENLQFLYDDINFFNNKGNIDYLNGKYHEDGYSCSFPFYSAYIDCTTGKIYPCDCTVHRDSELYMCGNLNVDSFADIWQGDRMNSIRQRLGCKSEICKENCDYSNIYFNIKIGDK